MVYFQSKSKELRTGRASGVNFSSRAGEDQYPSSQSGRQNIPLTQLFVLFGSSIDWMRPIQVKEEICFPQSTNSDVNLIQRHLHWHTQNNVGLNIWSSSGLLGSTNKIKHQRYKLTKKKKKMRGVKVFLMFSNMNWTFKGIIYSSNQVKQLPHKTAFRINMIHW